MELIHYFDKPKGKAQPKSRYSLEHEYETLLDTGSAVQMLRKLRQIGAVVPDEMNGPQLSEYKVIITKERSAPMVGKYGKAVVVKSLDPTFEKFAVVRPFTGTVWFATEAEAEQVCEKHNAVEIPR